VFTHERLKALAGGLDLGIDFRVRNLMQLGTGV